jgi:hypothetical protein
MFALSRGRSIEQPGAAADDLLQLFHRVKAQPHRDAEPIAQRCCQQALASGGADQGEAGQVNPDRTGRRSFADHEVERPILHRGIKHLFDRRIQPVNLVDEQDVAILQVGEKSGKVAGLGDDGTRRCTEADAHFAGEDPGQRGLAQSRRSEKENMVERFAARSSGIDEDAKVFARRLLADEFIKALWTKRRVRVFDGALWCRQAGGIGRAHKVTKVSS